MNEKMAISRRRSLVAAAVFMVAPREALVRGFLSSGGSTSYPKKTLLTKQSFHNKEPCCTSGYKNEPLNRVSMAIGSSPEDGGKSFDGWENKRLPHDDSADRVNSESAGKFRTDQYDGYDGAFPLPDDIDIPLTRQLRWEREAHLQSKFVSGDEVFELREEVANLRDELVAAREHLGSVKAGNDDRNFLAVKTQVKELERKILQLNSKDAEFVYSVALEKLKKAEALGDAEEMEKWEKEAEEARKCIPQMNMHGLWIGKYGSHGYEMINVTYSGDTMIATKVTGDKNVPRGEASFTVDLSPLSPSNSNSRTLSTLEPIELNARAARQWGKKYLPRHPGKGQVASEGYQNSQWMEGQLILVGRFFSFAWVPIGHQVFFGRPSPELTLKMLKEHKDEEYRRDRVTVMRDAVEKCWDETYWSEKEAEDYLAAEGCFE